MRESDGPRAHLQVLFKHALAKRMPRAFKGDSHAHFNASHPQHPALGSAAKTLMCVHTRLLPAYGAGCRFRSVFFCSRTFATTRRSMARWLRSMNLCARERAFTGRQTECHSSKFASNSNARLTLANLVNKKFIDICISYAIQKIIGYHNFSYLKCANY